MARMNFTNTDSGGPTEEAGNGAQSSANPANKRIGGGSGGNVIQRVVRPADSSALVEKLVVTPTNPPRPA